ncbi:hypothetical protein HYU10_01550 [Candidatus Woesearchaeota archaeon]|nr:hypothetical protein [Candidatus Woesearchaeota archaeon]MBI2660797.1 hypothetical protein [Candidatus Woesearchaeota archaeon]
MDIGAKNLIPVAITTILVLLAFMAGWINGQLRATEITGFLNLASPEFKAYTKAVCERNSNGVQCRDMVFVRCGNEEHAISLPNGTAEFSNGWTDSRNS